MDAMAQTWTTEVGVGSQFELTSNAALGEAGGRGDTILGVRPHIYLSREGEQFKFSGSASLLGLVYLNHTQSNRIQPEADLTASLKIVPRLLFLDANFRAFQNNIDPFGARQEPGSTSENSVTTVTARVTPRVEGTAGEHLRYLVRSDNAWLNESGATASIVGSTSEGYYGQHSAFIERDPAPGGWRLEAQRSDTRYRNSTLLPLVIDTARATILYSPGADIRLGVHAGYERTSFDENGAIYGVDAKWEPSPRTVLSGFGERRFFGSSWRLAFDHRTPAFAWNILTSRTLETSAQTQIDLPPTSSVAALLDGMFTTRFPDPAERARAVQDFITSRGLPTSTLQPISLRQQQLGILNLNLATVALIGIRNTVSLSGYHSRRQDALDASVIPSGGSSTNNTQVGASVAITHQLTPAHALTASADWSRITAPAEFGGERTTQQGVRLQVNMRPTPRTTLVAGARYRVLDSNTSVSGSEEAVFVGLDHRF
jgi:uncharacterized protein (PEP-CTERM system associated)